MNIRKNKHVAILVCKRVKAGHFERTSRHFLSTLIICEKAKVISIGEAQKLMKDQFDKLLRLGELKLDLGNAGKMGLLDPYVYENVENVAYVKLIVE